MKPMLEKEINETLEISTDVEINTNIKYCNKCGAEIIASSEFCHKCGNKINAFKIEKTNKINKKIKFAIIGIVVFLITFSSSIGYYLYDSNLKKEAEQKAQKEAEQKTLSEYEEKFSNTTMKIYEEFIYLQILCNGISSIWKDAINSGKDFNQKVNMFISLSKAVTPNKKYSNNDYDKAKLEIEEAMKTLQNPPDKYNEPYKLIVDLYGYYTQIFNQAMNPTVSLLTYNQDVNQKTSEFQKIFDKIKVIKPDIVDKIKDMNIK
jgi:hypothetical protein